MYEDPTPGDTDTMDDTDTSDTGTDTTDSGYDEMEVEIDGETYEAEENYDMDGDGLNDTAVVETEDGTVVGYEDTDADGTADVAVQYDEDGNPVAGATYDESTGEWEATDVEDLPDPAGGDGTDDGSSSSGDDSTDTTDTSGDDTSSSDDYGDDSTSSGEDINVDLPDGDVNAGPATYDTDGDGENDTAVTTDADGTTYAFTDVDGDGEADQAVVIESDGDVTVAEHTGTDEWTVVEEGHIDSSGEYTPDTSSSSDAAWAEK